jgi:hypothetical protein
MPRYVLITDGMLEQMDDNGSRRSSGTSRPRERHHPVFSAVRGSAAALAIFNAQPGADAEDAQQMRLAIPGAVLLVKWSLIFCGCPGGSSRRTYTGAGVAATGLPCSQPRRARRQIWAGESAARNPPPRIQRRPRGGAAGSTAAAEFGRHTRCLLNGIRLERGWRHSSISPARLAGVGAEPAADAAV